MSRLGKLQIKIPDNTKIILTSRICIIEGFYGKLEQKIPKNIFIKITSYGIFIMRKVTTKQICEQQGLVYSLLRNMIIGVSTKFEKKLKLIGIGYRASIKFTKLILFLGYSHLTFFDIPNELQVFVINNSSIIIQGIDKKVVSLFASKIRALKRPEPYKGKGVHYTNENLIRKIGKSNKN